MNTTCLHSRHQAAGGRMVDFAGWHLPIQYEGILEEHRAVRESAGMFDVSHMGRVEFWGPDTVPFLDRVFTADVAALEPGRAKYSLICTATGGILDDTILYCRRQDSFLLVCNAANRQPVLAWLEENKGTHRVTIQDITSVTGMIALQGPRSIEVISPLMDVLPPPSFHWTETRVGAGQAALARTGYTGEDGVEIMAPARLIEEVWDRLQEQGAILCGLGARDTLRLEAALPLHGHEITTETNPIEAGLGWAVALEKPAEFVGQDALRRARADGPHRRLVGFELTQRGIPRAGCPLLAEGTPAGETTSGGWAPTLKKGIGMGYLPAPVSSVGTAIEVDIRGSRAAALVVKRPFYRRAR